MVDILAKGLKFFATELRFLIWKNYPLKSLPEKFSAENFVILKLPYGRMEKLWDGAKINNISILLLQFSVNSRNTKITISRRRNSDTAYHPHCISKKKMVRLNMLYYFVSCLFLSVLLFFVTWLFPELKPLEEKLMSDNNTPQKKYDVFVSFRGIDIRRGFLSHLIISFKSKQINAFVDDKLKRGDEIWPSLVGAIEGSFVSLIIFSKDYASSTWCLEELVKILECKERYGHIVIPVFYGIEPTHVRRQSGSYKNAFAKHGRSEHKSKVQLWRRALNKSADLAGIESSKFQNDAELVKEIVNLVLKRLVKPSIISKGLFGIEDKIANVESLISKEPKDDTRVIGIWGMGGIGKTTLAEVVFNKLQSQYEGYDVKIDTPNSFPEDIVRRIGCMKVFIVLDDVNDSEHLEKLLGTIDNYGSGSRIIVTTRDEQVLRAIKADEIYHLKEISSDEALQLFNLNAFRQSTHQLEYKGLSEKVVNYAQGIPLVVNVLAGLLCGKTNEEWNSMLNKLKKMPPTKVYEALKLSYDSLDRKQQQIFLDLACFFLRTRVPVNKGDLEFLLKDNGSGNSVAFELGRLKDKTLITFSEDNIVCMHDSLQEMAWEIVRQESIEDPGSRSRLWDSDDIYKALKNDKVTEAIRSIRIDLATIKEQKLMPHIFAKMKDLKFLEISGNNYYNCYDQFIHAADGLQFLATELRFLYWENFPLKSLPENFSGEELVILNLRLGRMEKLWDGVKNLVNLKELDLSGSEKLKELPNLSKASNLEVLILDGCSMLTSVHPSIFSLPKLKKLDLQHCKSLTTLTSDSHLCSLNYLNLDGCENLWKFSLISENMKELKLTGTKVQELPSSFGHQSKLKFLHIKENEIARLPSSFNNLAQLLQLEISNFDKLEGIPKLPQSLETLHTSYCSSLKSLQELPLSLKTLHVSFCDSLDNLPKLPLSLKSLNVSFCGSLKRLPELPLSLKTLDVQFCTSLRSIPELPMSLETLHAISFKLLKRLPKLPQFLKTLDVIGCESLQSLPEFPPSLENLCAMSCKSLESLPELPQFLKTLDFSDCESLQSLPKLTHSLETLCAKNCKSLEIIPELPQFLKTLDVSGCESLQSLPELPRVLKTLDFGGCESLQSLPKFPPSLETLSATNCKSLESLPELPQIHKTLHVNDYESIHSLLEFPPSLETFHANYYKSLESIPELSQFLKTPNVSDCESLQSLLELPQFLKTLDVSGCESLQSLPEFPPSLENLHATNCKSLESLPDLPQFLKTLDVIDCESLQSLPELPPSLETLCATNCKSLESLPKLPQFLKTLDVSGCESLQSLPELPLVLKTLDVSGCESLQSLLELPLVLKTLDVSGCESLQSLPELPPSLETLRATNCKSLENLQKLPQFLKTLDVSGCDSLQSLPELPQVLKTLDVSCYESLQSLQEFPPSVETLHANYYKSLESIPELPQFLKTPNVSGCESLQSLLELPQFLKTLDISGCESLQNLPEFPPSLETLHATNCKSLESLPELPQFLKTLDVTGCESLQSLPEFPPSLETLCATNCKSLQSLPEFPQFLKTLDVIDCESLQSLPKFPPSLETLCAANCKSLESLPELPQFHKTLDVTGCESLQSLPEFPLSLETLRATNCKSLKSLPELPQFLKILDVIGCESLQSLPEFPPSLETLHAMNCKSLESLPELPQFLKTLDVIGCESLQSLPEFPPSLETLCANLLELPQFLKTLCLIGCESLKSLPEFSPSLETLCAKNCKSLKSLPELPQFLKNLDFPLSLESLHANNCKSLESLPELPPSLETLDASYCESLKSELLFPSTAVEQLKENRRLVQFRNCLNLDEDSLGAIGLNAQINIMKFANQHLSTPWHHHLKDHFGTYEVVYVYPGSSIPEWLEYKTTEDNVIINLSFAPPSPFLDFIFCFVFGNCQSRDTISKPTFYITVSSEGEGEKGRMYMEYLWEDPIESDHVCVVYCKAYFGFLSSRAKNGTRFKVQVKIETDDAVAQEVLKGFGVSPIGSSPYSCLTEQMELRDSIYIYRLREFSSNKALELFNLNVFNQSDHQMEYDELSKRVVNYAIGIPLVLKVLAYLRGKDKYGKVS
ncbi:Protein SUPPRESSOR OF npr1-1, CONSTITUTIVE 1, partial [Mucuna pruriens]